MALETENLELPAERIRPGVEAALLDENKGSYFIAEAEGKRVVGITGWSDWRNAWVVWIQSVFVREEFRRKGVYSALYHHIKGYG